MIRRVFLVVVDVGGATTDVYCVLSPDAEQSTLTPARYQDGLRQAGRRLTPARYQDGLRQAGRLLTPARYPDGLRQAGRRLGRAAVGVPSHRRTVEGDLGLRWSPGALLAAAADERLMADSESESLGPWVASRGDGSAPPETAIDRANELRLAGLAVTIALRRHVRAEAAYGVSGPAGASARTASTVVLSGAIRHATDAERAALVAAVPTTAAEPAGFCFTPTYGAIPGTSWPLPAYSPTTSRTQPGVWSAASA